MKATPLFFILAIAGALASCVSPFSCNPPTVSVVVDTSRTFVVDNANIFINKSTKHADIITAPVSYQADRYDFIKYLTPAPVTVSNDGGQTGVVMRIDTVHGNILRWIALIDGKGLDAAWLSSIDAARNAVFITGYYQDTAFFMAADGSGKFRYLVSHGLTDMFVARYRYDNGDLVWLSSGGGHNGDVLIQYPDTLGKMEWNSPMALDNKDSTIDAYAYFFGSCDFGGMKVDAGKGAGLKVTYDKLTGRTVGIKVTTSLPPNPPH